VARSIPPGEFWVRPDTAELIADFSTVTRLGFNTLEVSLPFPVSDDVLESLNQFVALASTYQLKVIVSLLNDYRSYQLEDIPKLLVFLDSLSDVLGHSNILAIRFNSDAAPKGRVRSSAMMRYLMQYAREVSQKPILTTDPALVTDADSLVLVDGLTTTPGSETVPLLLPIGFDSNLLSLNPRGQREQAFLYQMALERARQQKRGWIVNALFDLPKTHDSEPHQGVLEVDGTPKLAAKVFLGEHIDTPSISDRILAYRYILIVLVSFLVGMVMIGFWIKSKRIQKQT
jgi:hypothetical protein